MAENIVHLVLARTPDAPAGVRGISLFIVPKFLAGADGKPGKRNDLRCVSLEHKLGIHASPTCVMSFGDDGGAVGYLVGEEGRGLSYMFTMMNNARLSVGIQGLAIAERAYQQAAAFAKTRVQSKDDGSAETRAGLDHPPRRRPAHADDHARPDRGDARAGLLHRGRHRRRAEASRQGDGAQDAGPRRPADPDRQGVVHRPRQRDRLDRRAGPWRHGLHRGDRRRPASARCAHPADLRGHQRHPGARPGRPQGRQGRRRDHAGAGGRDARPGRGDEGGAGRRPRGDPRRRAGLGGRAGGRHQMGGAVGQGRPGEGPGGLRAVPAAGRHGAGRLAAGPRRAGRPEQAGEPRRRSRLPRGQARNGAVLCRGDPAAGAGPARPPQGRRPHRVRPDRRPSSDSRPDRIARGRSPGLRPVASIWRRSSRLSSTIPSPTTTRCAASRR